MTRYEWDENKNPSNQRKHGIRFEDAVQIFDGPVFTAEDIRYEYGEKRYISIGAVEREVVIVVAYTERGVTKRIISARKATRKEREGVL